MGMGRYYLCLEEGREREVASRSRNFDENYVVRAGSKLIAVEITGSSPRILLLVSPLALSGILRVNIGPERDNNRIRKGHGWKLESDARIRQQGPLYLGPPQLDRVADDYKTNKRRKTELVNLWLGIMVPGYS